MSRTNYAREKYLYIQIILCLHINHLSINNTPIKFNIKIRNYCVRGMSGFLQQTEKNTDNANESI